MAFLVVLGLFLSPSAAYMIKYYEGNQNCGGMPTVPSFVSDITWLGLRSLVLAFSQFTMNAFGCQPQGSESIAVSCTNDQASFAFYGGNTCDSTPEFQAVSQSGACTQFPMFESSYIVYCDDVTPSSVASSTISLTSSLSTTVTVSVSQTPAASPSPAPSFVFGFYSMDCQVGVPEVRRLLPFVLCFWVQR
jgi:hypothetical protein